MAKTYTADRLASELQDLVYRAEALIDRTSGSASATAQDLRGQLQSTLDRARGSLGQFQTAAVDHARAGARATDEYVHDNPWQSIGVAAGVGLLLGLLITRR